MAKLTIETEGSRKFWRFGLSEFVSVLALVVSACSMSVAIFVGIFQPSRERRIERQNDLIIYRNLACFSERLVYTYISGIESGEKVDNTTIQTVSNFLNEVKINQLPDASLVEYFVDLTRINTDFRKWNEQTAPVSPKQRDEMESSKEKIKDDLEKIDKYIGENALPAQGLAGGCSSTFKP